MKLEVVIPRTHAYVYKLHVFPDEGVVIELTVRTHEVNHNCGIAIVSVWQWLMMLTRLLRDW